MLAAQTGQCRRIVRWCRGELLRRRQPGSNSERGAAKKIPARDRWHPKIYHLACLLLWDVNLHFMTKHEPILIVGGGLGGLTTALALAQRGRAARVLEGAEEF